MPPAPMAAVISYEPKRVPGVSAIKSPASSAPSGRDYPRSTQFALRTRQPARLRRRRPTLENALLLVGRSAGRLRHVVLFHLLHVELQRAGGDLVDSLVEVDGWRLYEPRVVHARDHEGLEIRAGQALRLQLLDNGGHGIVEL